MRIYLTFILVLFVVGCANTGSVGNQAVGNADKAGIYKIIHDNISTKSDARRTLGDPSDIDFDYHGNEKWTYLHLDKSSLTRNYIPIVNFFSRGTKDTQKKVILIFDANGTLLKSAVTESVGHTKYGLVD